MSQHLKWQSDLIESFGDKIERKELLPELDDNPRFAIASFVMLVAACYGKGACYFEFLRKNYQVLLALVMFYFHNHNHEEEEKKDKAQWN